MGPILYQSLLPKYKMYLICDIVFVIVFVEK